MQKITPCLWFDNQAEQAARFYTGIFKDGRITETSYYTDAGKEVHGQQEGRVLTVAFELNGQPFTALNGGPQFKFNEALSLQVPCDTQEEIDYYWDKLGNGGDPAAQMCGWLKDKYGVSWQIFPQEITQMLRDPDREKAGRAMTAMMGMKKMDLAALRKAYNG
ncbi:VOC family protein [Pseudoduganella eburnea]|uniref:VOC family protein n=1 Tax=Massilia eburnea TaxID=1776165 RepID=A0A6L6QGS1_9BURK|nr:VOC family protein [Massilia eburnea]MTW11310.1 VOC family protein [Massilia eburnea]